MRDIKKDNYTIRFATRATFPQPNSNIIKKSSDAGYFNVSSIALTIVDLINFQNKIGGLNRIFHTIEELVEDLEAEDLINLLSWYPDKSDIQRMGYLFEVLDVQNDLQTIMAKWRSGQKLSNILLTPGLARNTQSQSNQWYINVNNEIEIEEW